MELRNYNNSKVPNSTVEKTYKTESKPKVSTKPENIHKDHRSRLKSQFIEHGIEPLTDVQKLELLLFYAIPQKDTNPIAHELISAFGSLKNVLKADYNQLVKVNGIKENAATLISLVNSMLNYAERPEAQSKLSSTSVAKDFVSRFYFNVSVEQFYVICLTKSNEVIKSFMIKSGTADEVDVQIRTITQVALDSKCNKIIISHNHPQGKAEMSDEDFAFTYSIVCSCMLNSIEVVDHIIVGTDKTISLQEQHVLQKIKERALNTIQIPRDKKIFLSSLSENYIID
jgi:DNA repair protein RadC